MTARTRHFVIASLLVLAVGLGSGLVAYYMGFSAGAIQPPGGPDELKYVPKHATLVAYADVGQIMASSLRNRLRQAMPSVPDGQGEFYRTTGINIETDVDTVIACVTPPLAGGDLPPGTGLVVARGRFDAVRIEALIREHGGTVEDYRGRRIFSAPARKGGQDAGAAASSPRHENVSLVFLEPGLVAIGTPALARSAVDLRDGGESVATNDEMMELVRSLENGNAWAVGKFDALTSHARLPNDVARQLPSLTWFAASAQVDDGLTGVLRAEARDETAAGNLRDVVRGFLALARMQAASRPELQTALDSLQLGGAGKTVSLGFTIPAELLDAIGQGSGQIPPPVR
jgi:hypothetical protein